MDKIISSIRRLWDFAFPISVICYIGYAWVFSNELTTFQGIVLLLLLGMQNDE